MTTAVETKTEVAQTVFVNDLVLTQEGVYRWSGEGTAGISTVTYSLRFGGVPRINIEADMVAPASLDSNLNLKDPRILVEKNKEGRPVTWVGPWSVKIAGEEDKWSSWENTKKDAVLKAARRLAIADWQAQGGKADKS